MSLTQERINEIALECAAYLGWNVSFDDVKNEFTEFSNLFLSRIREEQEAVRFDCHGHNAPAYGCNKPGDMSGEYFTIPPAASDCKELVEATRRDAELYRKLRMGHWSHGEDTLCVVSAKDIKLGTQTYSLNMLDNAIAKQEAMKEKKRC